MKPSSWILGLPICLCAWCAAAPKANEPPKLRYMFPLGATRGTTVHADIWGDELKGAYAVWSVTTGIVGRVKGVEVNPDKGLGPSKGPGDSGEKPPADRIVVDLDIDPTVTAGFQELRLVTPRGLSSPIQFRVDADPSVLETKETTEASVAQPISLPVIINGKTSKPGDVDYYRFMASAGQKFVFEVLSAEGVKPELKLYRPGGTWLNPDRPLPLLFAEQRTSVLIPDKTRYTWTADAPGSYLVAVGSLYGVGWPYYSYEVRVALAGGTEPPLKPALAQGWQERSFDRKLEANWVDSVRARTVEVAKPKEDEKASAAGAPGGTPPNASQSQPPAEPIVMPGVFREAEPNDTLAQANAIKFPALIEGTIQRPGDIDLYRMSVKAGQRITFEIETPRTSPPHFVPEITLTDASGHDVLSNIEEHSSPIATDGHPISYLKRTVPKLTFAPQGGGEYTLKIRDITARYGDESYVYRVLIRPQIAHVGEISLKESDQVNLVRGEARRIAIEASAEEGFDGEVVYRLTGLPAGIEALPGAANAQDKNPDMVEHAENLFPGRRPAVIVIMAQPDVSLTHLPALARLEFQPVVQGHLGKTQLVAEIPLMVVEGKEEK